MAWDKAVNELKREIAKQIRLRALLLCPCGHTKCSKLFFGITSIFKMKIGITSNLPDTAAMLPR